MNLQSLLTVGCKLLKICLHPVVVILPLFTQAQDVYEGNFLCYLGHIPFLLAILYRNVVLSWLGIEQEELKK